MNNYLTCNGCKHLVMHNGAGWCTEPCVWVYIEDHTTGGQTLVSKFKHGLHFAENTTQRMRAPGMPCGPDRLLFQPSLWTRIKARMGKLWT